MTKRKFMIIDLLILTAIGLVIEAVSLIFQFRYGSSGFYRIGENIYYYFPISITLVPVVIFIAIFRWDLKGVIVAFPLTLATCIIHSFFNPEKVSGYIYVVYLVGTLLVALNVLWFQLLSKNKMSKNLLIIIAYTLTGYLLIACGRSLVALFYGIEFIATLYEFLVQDLLSIVIGTVVIVIIYFQKTILVDIDQYLLSIKEDEGVK
jgi:hypothetical protein